MTFKVGDRVMDTYDYLGRGTVLEVDENQAMIDFDKYDTPKVREIHTFKEVDDKKVEFEIAVKEVLSEIQDTLISKNAAYGNSALEPVRVFSTSDPVEQLRVRIDDKLSRLKSSAADNEDTVLDLMGYLVLLRIATRKQDSE